MAWTCRCILELTRSSPAPAEVAPAPHLSPQLSSASPPRTPLPTARDWLKKARKAVSSRQTKRAHRRDRIVTVR